MSYPLHCKRCGRSFEAKRPHAIYCSDHCRWKDWEENGEDAEQRAAQRVGEHPLQAVRDQAALDKHTRDLNGLIRQAIIDAIKTRGECHADDLIPLYPEGEVDRCRELATRQFASLRSGKNPLISERERRASSIPARKRAKSGVYIFTKHGRETLVGSSSGAPGGTGVATARSGQEKDTAGLSPAAGDLGRPRDGRRAQPGGGSDEVGPTLRQKRGASPPVGAAADLISPPDHSQDTHGQNRDKSDQGRLSESTSSAAEGVPGVLQLDIPHESESSAYGTWEAA